jgi:anti-anti-sigma factor
VFDDVSDQFGISSISTPRALILQVTGAIDLSTSVSAQAQFQDAVAELLPPAVLVLDLTVIEVLSAAGARMMRELIGQCAQQGVAVRLVARPGSVVQRNVKILGLDEVAPQFGDLDQALDFEC